MVFVQNGFFSLDRSRCGHNVIDSLATLKFGTDWFYKVEHVF
jgi:hypothetical protein